MHRLTGQYSIIIRMTLAYGISEFAKETTSFTELYPPERQTGVYDIHIYRDGGNPRC